MYKIISITDHSDNDKSHYATLDHPQLLGDFCYLDMLRSGVTNGTEPSCYFVWADDTNKMLRTSRVQSMSEWDDKIKVVTENSVYLFERMEE